MKHFILGTLTAGLMAFAASTASAATYIETPELEAAVAAGKLPPVAERVPTEPLVVDFSGEGKAPGQHGGDLKMLIPKDRYLRHMVVYGYARLVGYDENFNYTPDILKDFSVDEGRIFTFHIRRGHKWSDGSPFTAEDFRYWWEDFVLNPNLNPGGVPSYLKVKGQDPKFEIIDELTVRYTWPAPNPVFLSRIAGASPLIIYRPSAYLKQFHERYQDAETLKAMVAKSGRKSWASLHHKRDSMYKFKNPKQPTLQPWKNTTKKATQGRFVGKRNPFFHRVDANGRQLPYINRFILTTAASALIPAQASTGGADLQALGIKLNDWAFLKKAEDEGGDFELREWKTATGSIMALHPNLNYSDDIWRNLFQDVRFRRALSLATDRDLLNELVYFGEATVSNNTVLADSPLFKEAYRSKWTEFNKKEANRLLDELGLTKRGSERVRLLPDGRPMEIIVETSGEDPQQTDILELMKESWKQVGIKLFIKASQRDVFRKRVFGGQAQVAVWFGIQSGMATPATDPRELAPTTQYSYQWPSWGLHHESNGKLGTPPTLPEAKRLLELHKQWTGAIDDDTRAKIWHEMLAINADQVFTIGLLASIPQPVVVRKALKNVPENGVYHWDPGAYFGVYHPDGFWYDDPKLRNKSN